MDSVICSLSDGVRVLAEGPFLNLSPIAACNLLEEWYKR
jgi:hypothetical protein